MLKLACDIETRHGHISCIGFAWSNCDAICIPFMCADNNEGYWSFEEELAIIEKLRELLSLVDTSQLKLAGQNWHYDAQYIARHWGINTYPSWGDTMLMQHVCFPGMQKSLDFIASMYCDWYVFWKDDGKEANLKLDDEQGWIYNCDDNCYTYECAEVLNVVVDKMQLRDQYERMMRKWIPLLHAMLRGTLINKTIRSAMAERLMQAMTKIEEYFHDILGHPLNPKSPKQMATLFYDDFKCKVQRNKDGNPSCDKKALAEIVKKEPLLIPLVEAIESYRTMGVFLSTFVMAELDWDGRMRTMYGLGGTETFRLNSRADAFGFGTNLQNIPSNRED